MPISLKAKHLYQIRTHAEATYPNECCGLLLGRIEATAKTVVDAIATENSWNQAEAAAFAEATGQRQRQASQGSNFSIAPREMLAVQKQARAANLDIVGIYHSHPDHPAKPSEFDRAIAWPVYSYLIVAVPQGQATEILSWTLDDEHQFQEEAIAILET
jgi:proteasome lid subunit RPN8/RPN11